MIRGVIFDIDGVVLDSLRIWKDLPARYLLRLGIEAEEGLGEVLFSMSMEQGAAYLKEHYELAESTEDILESIRLLLQNFYFNEVQAKPGAGTLMRFLREKEIRITAATSSPRAHIETALLRNDLLGFFDVIYTTGEVGISKHFPDIYNKAADYMGIGASETLVIEDSLYALKTAKNAGYKTVGVYDPDGEPDRAGVEATCDIYIRDLSDIIDRWDELRNKTERRYGYEHSIDHSGK